MISSNMKKSYYDCTYKIPGCDALFELQTIFQTFLLGLTPEENGGKQRGIELLLGAALMGLDAKCLGELRDRASGTKEGFGSLVAVG